MGSAADVGAWQVPGDWEVRVTEQGAVREWTGKTWCGHVQGMCVSSNALYFAFHNQIVKTDWYGRLLKRADNLVKHTGDICYWNGRLYTIICHAKPVEGVPGSPASIQMFDEDLNIVKTKNNMTNNIVQKTQWLYLNAKRNAMKQKKNNIWNATNKTVKK